MNRFGGSSLRSAGLGAIALLTTLLGVPPLWAQVELKVVGQAMEHKFNPQALHFSPDGSRLMTKAGVMWLWDVKTQRIVGDGIMGPNRTTGANRPKGAPLDADKWGTVVGAAFTPNGKSLIVVSQGHLQRWDPAKARPLAKAIRVVSTGRTPLQKLETLQGPVAFSPDRKVALVHYGSSRATVTPRKLNIKGEYDGLLINTATGKVVARLHYDQHVKVKNRSQTHVSACAFTEDGKKVITLHGSGEVRVWNAATGKPAKPVVQLPQRGSRHLAPDGKSVATVDYNNLELWSLETGKVLGTLKRWASATNVRIAFSHDSRKLALFGPDAKGHAEVQVLAMPSLKVQAALGQDRIRDLVFSPDGKSLLTIAEDSPMKLWDAATGELRASVKGNGAYQTAAFSPDGTLLATCFGTAGPDRSQVQLWRLPGGPK